MMMKKSITFLVTICFLFVLSMQVVAEEKAKAEETTKAEDSAKVKHEYVGVKKCMICHKKDSVYPSWMETQHAKAWESLKEEDQKKKECITCHSTGTTAEGELLTGVQCESCHGPGSDYKKMSIMKDREQAIANGMIVADEKTCIECHNEKIPKEFQPKEEFNYEKMKATGVHAVKQKVEEKKSDKE
jgi:nitrate/TMAO reductase-like tetraheme cytochrome c subunit